MICPICNSMIKDEAKFCGKCGSMIPRCPTCGKIITEKTNFCTNDGTPLPENIIALFPNDLRTKNNTIPNEVIQTNIKSKKKKRLFPIIVVLLILVLICVSITTGYMYLFDEFPWEAMMSLANQKKVQTSALAIPELSSETMPLAEPELTNLVTPVQVPTTESESNMLADSIVESESDRGIDMSAQNDLEYFITHCDVKYFSKEDLISFDENMCRLARNGIYARSGRKFDDVALQTYFSQYNWYVPKIAPNDFSESMLNEYQIANRDLIVKYEKEALK